MYGAGKLTMVLESVRSLSLEFRKAIESCLNNKCFESGESMYSFPRGCCGDCTELVGEYLINNNIEDLWYVCGTHYPKTKDEEANFQGIQSHAWISFGHPSNSESLIVDITGDQFKHNPEYNFFDQSVYVGKIDSFHKSFEVENRNCYRFY